MEQKDWNKEYKDVIAKVQQLLKENPTWEEKYKKHGEKILYRIKKCGNNPLADFNKPRLTLRLNVTAAKGSPVAFDLCYLGQVIGKLRLYADGARKLNTEKQSVSNRKYFTNKHTPLKDKELLETSLKNEPLNSQKAEELIAYFCEPVIPIKREDEGEKGTKGYKKNNEHRIESLLSAAFSKASNDENGRADIQDVEVMGVHFAFTTAIKASEHGAVCYGNNDKGGGVDILTCVNGSHLCVVELKDENIGSELPTDALEQAIAYATFLHALLRSESGQQWYEIFGFKGDVPKPLKLYAACAMPDLTKEQREELAQFKAPIKLNDTDTLELHWISFNEKDNVIQSIESSFDPKA